MKDNDYSKQRESGIKLINEFIKEEAEKNGLTISSIIWDNGRGEWGFSDHTLIINSDQKEVTVTLPDAAVADYPSLVGNEKTKAVIRAALTYLNK